MNISDIQAIAEFAYSKGGPQAVYATTKDLPDVYWDYCPECECKTTAIDDTCLVCGSSTTHVETIRFADALDMILRVKKECENENMVHGMVYLLADLFPIQNISHFTRISQIYETINDDI